MEEQQSVFQKLMNEQKEAFTKRINDLENEIKTLKVALKNAQGSSTSDSSSWMKTLFSRLFEFTCVKNIDDLK